MLASAALILSGGAKGLFEDPAYLIGVPLLALGVIGMLIALSPVGISRRRQAEMEMTSDGGGEGAAEDAGE